MTRATRVHQDIRQGSSVRGAIDCALVAAQLAAMRGIVPDDRETTAPVPEESTDLLDAMSVALSGRIHLDEAAGRRRRTVLRQIWEDHFLLSPAAGRPG